MADGYASSADPGSTETPEAKRKPPDLARLKRYVSEAQSLTAQARLESLTDVDYYDGHQLTTKEKADLKDRGQPDIVINRTRVAVNGILGVTEQGRSEPRAYPRTPQDEDSADVVTDVLRYVADFNRFPRLKQDCFLDMLVPGSCAALVGADADLNVTIEQVRWEEFIYDPKSRRKDFTDARYLGIAKWMYEDDAAALYPKSANALDGAITNGSMVGDVSFMDRPDNAQQYWIDRRNRRLMVVELYYREDGWQRCVFFSDGILEEGESPYVDDKGRTVCPIIGESSYVDRNNNRYGVVRDMRGPQDEINKRRSKLLHLINASQIQEVQPGSGMGDVETARKEAAKPDGVIPPGWQKVPTTDMASGQAELLTEAKAELERLGPNPAILGRQGADQSGRALLARQQAGVVELAVVFGALEDWELRIYRHCWMRARQFWKAPQYIRVTDDEDSPQFVGLNVPRGAPVLDPRTGQPVIDRKTGKPAEGPPPMDPKTGKPLMHPLTGEPVLGYKNVVAEMDADITLDTQPNTANIQQEQFQDLVQLVGSNPIYAQQVPFSVMLKLSAVPHKRALIDELEQGSQADPQLVAMQQQMQQMQQQLALAMAKAKVDETNTKAQKNTADAALASAKAAQAHSSALVGVHGAVLDAQAQQQEQQIAAHELARETLTANTKAGLTAAQAYQTFVQGIHDRQMAEQTPYGPAAGDQTGA